MARGDAVPRSGSLRQEGWSGDIPDPKSKGEAQHRSGPPGGRSLAQGSRTHGGAVGRAGDPWGAEVAPAALMLCAWDPYSLRPRLQEHHRGHKEKLMDLSRSGEGRGSLDIAGHWSPAGPAVLG